MEHINTKLVMLSTGVAMVGGAITKVFGGWSGDFKTLLFFMVTDFFLGIICAGVFKKSTKTLDGALSSSASFKGIAKKICALLLVAIAYRIDLLLSMNSLRTMTILALLFNELISITENMGLIGIPIPAPIKKAISILKNKTEE